MGMSIAAAGRKGGRRRRGVPRYGAMADINMTPFIDVMLVLLIIFMVAAPMAAVSVKVDLPPAVAKASPNPPKPVYISLQPNGRIFIMDKQTDLASLGDDLRESL
ncbi:MAG TPA: biopolymer transporter ExbD, partial [Roseiarcus sp.]|nr:biopolymer transporter ExbD [Roseiarcus sp.]